MKLVPLYFFAPFLVFYLFLDIRKGRCAIHLPYSLHR
nr:MAG TPA: hypothetical protein [Caudoviricetes sp.]